MSHSRPFAQVDVFTTTEFKGNPLAVVLDGYGLSSREMQNFTDWTNLSEATFILPPTDERADYQVRIFSPGRELPFAGHPTIGTAHAWLAHGGKPKGDTIVQECGAGLVRLRRDGDRLYFAAPPLLRHGPLPEADVGRIAAGLGVPRSEILAHSWCANGPHWRTVMLPSADEVLAVMPDPAILGDWDVGVVGLRAGHTVGDEFDHDWTFEVRAFFPTAQGMAEDPVTGSLNAALAQWLISEDMAPGSFSVRQGTALGRNGRVYVHSEHGDVWVGGDSVVCINGTVDM